MSGYIGTQPVPQATQTRQTFTATLGQTSFATAGYAPNYLDVYLNGVHLLDGTDYTASNGSDIVLAAGAAAGDILEMLAYSTFTVADQAFTGTTTTEALTVTGAFTSLGIDDNATATAMTLDASGNVGIGTSPVVGVHLRRASGNTYYRSQNNLADVDFGVDGAGTGILWNNSNYPLAFGTNGTERLRINASGTVLVGTTSYDTNVQGHAFGANGYAYHTSTSNVCLDLNRKATDGTIAQFKKDNTTVASIGTTGGDTYFRKNSGAGVYCSSTAVLPFGAHSLGQSSDRWSDLYLSGGVYLGGTGAANKLDDYEEGTWTPSVTGSTSNPTVTYVNQYGRYVKVGRLVQCFFHLQTSTISGGSGTLRISGLPFQCNPSTVLWNVGSIGYTNNFTDAPTRCMVQTGTNVIVFYTSDSTTNPRSDHSTGLTVASWTASGDVYTSIAYETDS